MRVVWLLRPRRDEGKSTLNDTRAINRAQQYSGSSVDAAGDSRKPIPGFRIRQYLRQYLRQLFPLPPSDEANRLESSVNGRRCEEKTTR